MVDRIGSGLVAVRSFDVRGSVVRVSHEKERIDNEDNRVEMRINGETAVLSFADLTFLINELLYARDHADWDEKNQELRIDLDQWPK